MNINLISPKNLIYVTTFSFAQGKMISNDRQEKERVDARNALEEFVYENRNKLQNGGNLFEYIDDQSREDICRQLEDVENWLYEDGECVEREVYKNRLDELNKKIDPVKLRHDEYEGQQQAFNDLGHAIQMAHKAVQQYRSGDPRYDHLTETEMLNITEAAEKTQKWFEDARGKLSTVKKTQDPPVKLVDARHECQTLTTCVNSVINRPKPRPPTPPPVAKQETNPAEPQPASDGQNNTEPNLKEDNMDVD
jgi:heat shock protein